VIRVHVPAAQLSAGPVQLREREHHYLTRVRRVRVGDAVELFDGLGGSAAAVIRAIDAAAITLQVEVVRRDARRGAELTALIPLLKGDRMDQCVEKLVEVGVDRLVLWSAARSVVRLDGDKREARLERMRAQVLAAARQCGRADVPELDGVWTLEEVAQRCQAARRVALAPRAAPLSCDDAIGSLALLSGPEGGLTAGELDALQAAGFVFASLGATVLRADTAPVVATAIWRWAEHGAARAMGGDA
jgi:16S rRNA (uracil1498-N3)-methyltransferase